MDCDDKILTDLQKYFPGIQLASEEMPVNYIVCDEESKVKFYVVIKPSNDEEWKTSIESLEKYLGLPKAEKLSVIVFKISEKKELLLGMLCYWNFDRLRFNKEINWRTLDEKNVQWLRMQLKARHARIAFLPVDYIRVVKTIDLCAEGYFDARIVYLRRFYGEGYRMQQHTEVTQEDRFNRLLNGTPQNEYPSDYLDELILKEIREVYPNAYLKNKLLLFDVDLLNYRLEKENRTQTINLELQLYTKERNDDEVMTLPLECYYQLNAFRPHPMRERVLPTILDKDQYQKICELRTTYDKLSAINI